MSDQNQTFLNEVEKRLTRLFKASREGYKSLDSERHRLEGFINAGVFLGLTTNAEIRQLMERTHQSVFKQSIEERRNQQSTSWSAESINYDYYDIPTFER